MQREVSYLMSGIAHMPYLIVSLKSLRHFWDGRVVVNCFPESYKIGQRIAQDDRLGIEAKLWDAFEIPKRSNIQFLNKIKMMQEQTIESRVYLDADTTIHHKLEPLFEMGEQHGFAATQFCHWLSTGSVIRARLSRLLQFPEIDRTLVEHVMTTKYPSPNGGIFACLPNSPVLPRWLEWSMVASTIFICDEAVLHLLQVSMAEHMHVIEGGEWNCSHKYQQDIRPKILHYHGDSNVRPDKSPRAYAFWMPKYQQCISENIGGVAEWKDEAEAESKWFRRLKEERK